MRRMLVAGNWKMNGSHAALAELDAIAASAVASPVIDAAICPPFTLIERAVARAGALPIGAQDCHAADKGAHTGCVSAPMLKEAGARLVIVGHSERRADQHETSEEVRAKAEAAIRHGLTAIVCVGETEAERDSGKTLDVVGGQLDGSVPPVGTGATLVIAYEPVWAIGTGRTPSVADVAEVHGFIRKRLGALLGDEGAKVRILYGGSVKGENAIELLGVADVDGALVGGASLTAAQFVPIIEAAVALSKQSA
ncbi:triose-phosphate isomerase [Tardibacter chloracetimidivorans]|uniref:Triosephosphate isomerase n=1 Tax=Tardibacter chloracetimidivorans TaxID=1921510 RepID=A0A1L3ZRA0_9SPHN|nr:triose-phosphate isomerase [Tardibacter chloracetimidivorans]API58157.1 triose-phosphate isomerase [Tardibacter chloracetimidivorans]